LASLDKKTRFSHNHERPLTGHTAKNAEQQDEVDALLYGYILHTPKRNRQQDKHDAHAIPERRGHSYLHCRALVQAHSLLGHRMSLKGYHASADPQLALMTPELE